MEYRFLGNTGIKVSVISYGSYLTQLESGQQERTTSLVKKALELGINFFDTAEVNHESPGHTSSSLSSCLSSDAPLDP